MRPRLELLAAVLLLLLLGTLAGVLGRRGNKEPDQDRRRSTFLAGPYGARGFRDALAALGVDVQRVRMRLPPADSLDAPLFAVLGPTRRLDAAEGVALADLGRHRDLLLAGGSSRSAMRCFGYAVERRRDSLPAVRAGEEPGETTPWVQAVLAATGDTLVADSTGLHDATVAVCPVVRAEAVESLLVTPGGRLVAARLHVDATRRVVLVADDMLFSNRLLRATDAGVFALGLVAGRYDRIAVDEWHHGYGPQGSLAGAVLAWSSASPLGWGAWQLLLVGLLALAAGLTPTSGALRFGPPRPPAGRVRRSPLEHVRALATALSSARGHDVAIALTVQGLARRLSGAGHLRRLGSDPVAWLRGLEAHADTPRARRAIARLISLTRPGQSAGSVLTAARAVEDVWEELKP